jgi:hypothetical protein
MGFDNWDVMIDGSRPRLTSVDMNLEQLGRTAARCLFRAIGGDARACGVEQFPADWCRASRPRPRADRRAPSPPRAGYPPGSAAIASPVSST